MQDVEFDKCGKMKFHPEFHPYHKKPWSEEDLEYLCRFYEFDCVKSLSLALGRTEYTIETTVWSLRKSGKYEYYKTLSKHY